MNLFRIEDNIIDLDKILFIHCEHNKGYESYDVIAEFENKSIILNGFEYYWQAKDFMNKIVKLLENKYEVTDYDDL